MALVDLLRTGLKYEYFWKKIVDIQIREYNLIILYKNGAFSLVFAGKTTAQVITLRATLNLILAH